MKAEYEVIRWSETHYRDFPDYFLKRLIDYSRADAWSWQRSRSYIVVLQNILVIDSVTTWLKRKDVCFVNLGELRCFSVFDYWIMEKFKTTVVRLSLGVIFIASIHVCLCAEQNSHVEEFHMVQGIRLLLTHSYHFFLGQFFLLLIW